MFSSVAQVQERAFYVAVCTLCVLPMKQQANLYCVFVYKFLMWQQPTRAIVFADGCFCLVQICLNQKRPPR